MTAHIEYTDTFGGEANYSWVQRHNFNCDGMSDYAVMLKAKRLLNLTGIRGQKETIGEMIEFRPYNFNTVMFITFSNE